MLEQPLEDLFARLERERRLADRLYTDALRSLERAVQMPPGLPEPPALFQPTPAPPPGGGVNGIVQAIRDMLWRLLGTSRHMEQRLHDLVSHAHWSANLRHTVVALLAAEQRALQLESVLMQYLQTISRYVETKDDQIAGSDMRDRLALVEQRLSAVARAVEDASRRSPESQPSTAASGQGSGPGRQASQGSEEGSNAAFAGQIRSAAYVGFEGRFRGAREEIERRVEDYVALFKGAPADVLDVGCGRGELLELLRASGVGARGVDTNAAMVEACRSRGLAAEQGDAVGYLSGLADGAIGGLAAIQVVEHFEPGYLVRFLETAHRKLRVGSVLVLETINPACWAAFFESYIRDLTHERPLHPETLRYLVEAAGFSGVNVQFRQPLPETERLDRVDLARPPGQGGPDLRRAEPPSELQLLATALNAHADKLNRRLFSAMDYAVVARR